MSKIVLITGAGKRVGAVVAEMLHAKGMRVIIHYRHSAQEAKALCEKLNQQREHSAAALQANLSDRASLLQLADHAAQVWGQIDVLINNASNFYPTPFATATEDQWEELFSSNLKAPFFLTQAIAPYLIQQKGCIINMIDIQAHQPLKDHAVYCMAKAGLLMMTKTLAKELGPFVRVNAISPGVVLWAEHETDLVMRDKIIARTLLKREGSPEDIARAALFLIEDAGYMTGQVITVDGGRSLNY